MPPPEKPCPCCAGTGRVEVSLGDMCANCGCEFGAHTAGDKVCAEKMRGGGYRVRPGSTFALDAPASPKPIHARAGKGKR